MTTELKQAAQQALLALEKSQPHPSNPVIGLTKQDFIDHEETIRQLRTAIQQAEAKTGEPVAWVVMNGLSKYQVCGAKDPADALCSEMQKRHDLSGSLAAFHVQPLYTHPAPGVPEFSRIAKFKLDELQKQGFAITGYAIQCGTQRGFITNGGFVGWWRSDEAPSVPDDVVLTIYELREIQRAVDDFSDCGETDVPDRILMRGVMAGYLECTNYMVLDRDGLRDAIDAIDDAMLAAK